ncbi:MAG: hypothetical protein U1F43_17990 [Myxococcota bacterium]
MTAASGAVLFETASFLASKVPSQPSRKSEMAPSQSCPESSPK